MGQHTVYWQTFITDGVRPEYSGTAKSNNSTFKLSAPAECGSVDLGGPKAAPYVHYVPL